MHRILVEERRWLGDRRFLHALNFCMILPGPEAMQLAVYIGWLMNRTAGGIVAGLLFVLPGALAILGLSAVYALYGQLGPVGALFFGLKAAVLAIVAQAVVRIGRRVPGNRALLAIAAAAFLALFVLGLPFPLVILAAAAAGVLAARAGAAGFGGAGGHGRFAHPVDDAETALGEGLPPHAGSGAAGALRLAALFLVLWLAPVAALAVWAGPAHVFTQIAGFFSLLAVLTFGGAYAVLAWVAQAAVQGYGWLAPAEMLDGLGLAETTPGPLILVTQFVGFLAAFRDPGGLPPLAAGVLGAALTTWVTFVPCFLWIFLGAPWIERLRGNRALAGAMTAITAAVVGVILNLALWFALHVLFAELRALPGLAAPVPVWSSLDAGALALVLGAFALGFGLRQGPAVTLAACAAAGLGLRLAGLG